MFQHCSCSRKWVIISFIFQVIFSEDMKLKSRSLASLHVFSLWAVLPSIEGGTQVSYMSPPLNTLYLSYHQMLLILPSKSFFIISALFDILKSLLPTPFPRFHHHLSPEQLQQTPNMVCAFSLHILRWSTRDLFSALSFQQ